jgi:uncharacterized protein YoxC
VLTEVDSMDVMDAKAIMWIGLAVLFVCGGIAFAFISLRLGRLITGVENDLHRTVDGVVPIMAKAGVTIDEVNGKLAKVDSMLDSAVDATDAIDTAVRAVSDAVVEPVRVVSSVFAGATAAVDNLRGASPADSDDQASHADVAPEEDA